MRSIRASRRTFLIERRGTTYALLHVWEKGEQINQDWAWQLTRLSTDHERIVADQSSSVCLSDHEFQVAIESPDSADRARRLAVFVLAAEDPQRTPLA